MQDRRRFGMFNNRRVIGICTAELDKKFHLKLLQRVMRELTQRGYYVMVFTSDSDLYNLSDSDIADASIFDLTKTNYIDVVVLFAETIKQQSVLQHIVKQLTQQDIPVISVEKETDQCYNVIYDQEAAFEKMVRHVVEYHDVKEINFISGFKGNEVAESRLEIYQRVLEENNILYEAERVGYGDFWEYPTRKVMEEFLSPGKLHPEAIICANDSMAVTVCDFLKERQLRVPEDVIVAGFDGIEEGVKHTPGITTCARNEVQDAKVIAGLVQELCDGSRIAATTVLDYHIQLSQSCGCQKNHIFDADTLITELNRDLATHYADVRWCGEMREAFFACGSEDDFWNLTGNYLPENSFLCINEGLNIEKDKRKKIAGKKGPFTDKMQSIVKFGGKTYRSDCDPSNVVPDLGKDMTYSMPVIVLPIHYCDKVLGYMGLWAENGTNIQSGKLIHFILSYNHSAGQRLVQ